MKMKRVAHSIILVICLGVTFMSSSAVPFQAPTFVDEITEVFEEIVEPEVPHYLDQFRGELPIWFIEVVILVESEGNPRAVSYAGIEAGAGLMQVSDVARRDYNNNHGTSYTTQDLFDPAINIMIGCWLLNHYEKQLGSSNPERLYVAYNAGIGNCLKYYYTHYSKGIHPSGTRYRSLERYNKYRDEYYSGNLMLALGGQG
jgi:hypothetical protein